MPKSEYAYINASLLKKEREKYGIEPEELAKSAGIKVSKLIAVEEGKALLTFPQFLKIANKLKRLPGFFYLEHEPREDLPRDFRRIWGGKRRLTPLLRKSLQEIAEKREFAVQNTDLDPDYGTYDYSFVGSISVEDECGKVARKINAILQTSPKFRRKWKDPYTAFRKWKERLENIGVLVFQISGIDVEIFRGFSIAKVPYPTIAVNRKDAPLGRIFTLIHEFCHIMLNKDGICTAGDEDEESSEIEKYCNKVAGETLVPSRELENNPTVVNHGKNRTWDEYELKKLSRVFWASREVILRKLLMLNKTDSRFYGEMKRRWQQIGNKRGGGPEKTEKRVLRSNPRRFIDMVLGALHENRINIIEAADILNIKTKYINTLEKELGGI